MAGFILLLLLCQKGLAAMEIDYLRYDYHSDPEPRRAQLPVLVYDIPYFGACGIFPPYEVSRQVFLSGGSDGGMSPGATWQPFELSKKDYAGLVEIIKILDPASLGEEARYTYVRFAFDHSFDHLHDRLAWLVAVCEKYKESHHQKLDQL
ncbi:MAG: hypothetical protein ACK5ME_11120 [Parahaliea sp.]